MQTMFSKCTDKTPKKHYWGGEGQLPAPPPPPPSGYASASETQSCTDTNVLRDTHAIHFIFIKDIFVFF